MGIVLVFLAGLAINSHNTGGVASGKEAIQDIKASFEHPVNPDWSKLNK